MTHSGDDKKAAEEYVNRCFNDCDDGIRVSSHYTFLAGSKHGREAERLVINDRLNEAIRDGRIPWNLELTIRHIIFGSEGK